MQNISHLIYSICAIYIHLVFILDFGLYQGRVNRNRATLTKMLMLFITNYRSIFGEIFLCPDIPHLKRAGFTDMFDKWQKANGYEGIPKKILMQNGTTLSPNRLERPFIYQENNKLKMLCLAAKEENTSYTIFVPLNTNN